MDIAAELAADQTGRPVQCHLCLWLEDRPDRAEWEAQLARPSINNPTFVKTLFRLYGLRVSEDGVRRHRKGHRR